MEEIEKDGSNFLLLLFSFFVGLSEDKDTSPPHELILFLIA